MTLGELRRQFTADVALLIAHINATGHSCQLEEAVRGDVQAKANALSQPDREWLGLFVRNGAATHGGAIADLGNSIAENKSRGIARSNHLVGLAVDLSVFDASGTYCNDASDYEPFGVWWESLRPGLTMWGGRFGDADHFSCLNNGVK